MFIVGDPHRFALRNFKPTLLCQGSVGFGNRVEVNPQVGGQTPYSREGGAFRQLPVHDEMAQLVHDLPVGRGRGNWVDDDS